MRFHELLTILEGKSHKPKIVERLIGQLKRKGMNVGQATATAYKTLQQSGVLKHGSIKLTKKGKKRQSMGAEGRAKDREAKRSGRSTKDYVYSKKTNRATLRK